MNNLFQFLSTPFHLRFTIDEVCNKYYILGLHFVEVNIAINIKVETLFRGANVFRERGGK